MGLRRAAPPPDAQRRTLLAPWRLTTTPITSWAINAQWAATHPDVPELIVHSVVATTFVKDALRTTSGEGTDIAGKPKLFTASGTHTIHAVADAATFFGSAPGDPRVPDLYATTQPGTVYTGKTAKIAEHGGVTPAGRNVPLVVAGPGIAHREVSALVATAQIAPTILSRLHLDPQKLQAVVVEHTATLPGM